MNYQEEPLILRIGDYIALQQPKPFDGYISAGGIISDDCFVSNSIDFFSDCLWEIHVQYQYSASKEFAMALSYFCIDLEDENLNTLSATLRDEDIEYLNQLKKAMINEKRLNEKLMAMKTGKPVAFGDILQLRHVKSKKFLSVSMTALAKNERENMRVTLESEGSLECCFSFMPRMKHDRDGQPILGNSELYIRSHNRSNEFLHVAKKATKADRREVNCSLESSAFSVVVFQQAMDTLQKSILAGDVISFQEPETCGYLAVEDSMIGLTDRAKVVITPPIQISAASFNSIVGTQLLWSIECLEPTKGGRIASLTDKVLLRDLNTSLFMQMTDDGLYAVKNRADASTFEISYVSSSDNRFIGDGAAVYLSCKGRYLSTKCAGTPSTAVLPSTPSGNNATNAALELNKHCHGISNRGDALSLVVSAEIYRTIGIDMFVGVLITLQLRSFTNAVLMKKIQNESQAILEEVLKVLFSALDCCWKFLQIESETQENMHDEHSQEFFLHKSAEEILKMRQTMFREQGVINAILDIIELCSRKYVYLLDLLVMDHKKAQIFEGVLQNANVGLGKFVASRVAKGTDSDSSGRRGAGKAIGNGASSDMLRRITGIFGDSGERVPMNESSTAANRHEGSVPTRNGSILLPEKGLRGRTSSLDISEPHIHHGTRMRTSSVDAPLNRLRSVAPSVSREEASTMRNGNDDMEDGEVSDEYGFSSERIGAASEKRPIVQELANYCLRALLESMRSNHVNQIFVADRLSLLLEHAKNQSFAVLCVQELLRDNVEVLQTKVSEREINMLVQLLVDSEMNVTFLKLIQSTCSMGFDTTQGFVTEALFGLPEEEGGATNNKDVRTTEIRVRSIVGFPQTPLSTPSKQPLPEHSTDIVIKSEGKGKVDIVAPKQGRKSIAVGKNGNNRMTIKPNARNSVVSNGAVDVALRFMQSRNTLMMSPSITSKKDSVVNEFYSSIYSKSEESSLAKSADVLEGEIIQHTNLLLTIVADRETVLSSNFDRESIFIPKEELMLKQVLGHSLLSYGTPKVYVDWPHGGTTGPFSMLATFGLKTKVPIDMIYFYCGKLRKGEDTEVLHQNSFKKLTLDDLVTDMDDSETIVNFEEEANGLTPKFSDMKRRKGSNAQAKATLSPKIEKRVQIANFLIAQLYLVGDLCRDRQYVAMGILENIYEYDVLIALLSMPNVPNRFKAPICRVLRFLYVDREPQVEAKFPRLIRTSVSLGGGEENSFSDHHSGSPYAFALLQQLVSIYIHRDLNTNNCDSLSAEMMDLLHALTMFGFYYTDPHLKDILKPLIKALHAHTIPQKSTLAKDLLSESTAGNTKESIFSKFFASLQTGFSGFVSSCRAHVSVSPYSTIEGDDSSIMSKRTTQTNKSRETVIALALSKGSIAALWKMETETIRYLIVVLLIVFCAVCLSLYQLIVITDHGSSVYRIITIFDLLISCFFIVELTLRLLCHFSLFHEFFTFWEDIFNVLDTSVVTLDIVVLSLGLDPALSHAAGVIRTLRIVRVFRLLRTLRAAKLMKKVNELSTSNWQLPSRFSNLTDHESSTLVGILKILYSAMDRIQDKRLSVSIKAFVAWVTEVKVLRQKSRSAVEVYKSILAEETDLRSEIPNDFDKSLTDLLMFNDPTLTQQALNLLMVFKSSDKLLGEAMKKVQIIYSPKVEAKCKEMATMLRDLKRMADMFEIWGDLESEEDCATAEEMLNILNHMSDIIAKPSNVNKAHATVADLVAFPDPEVQQLLLNLDAMSTFMTLQTALFDGGSEPVPTILKLWSTLNLLICNYLRGCPANQEGAFKYIGWFVSRVDDNVNSSAVVRAILRGNRDLIKNLPRHYLGDFAKMILTNGRRPEYLDLFVAVVEPAENGIPVHVKSIQNEVVKYLTSREWKDQIAIWCAPIHSVEFTTRRNAMLNCSMECGDEVDDKDLPALLKYHVNYLALLANCNLGPKLQAMYSLEDVLNGIIDSATVFPVRRALGNLLLVMCRSEIVVQGIEVSQHMWQFFDMTLLLFEISENDLGKLFRASNKNGPKLQRIEWIKLCLNIVSAFFSRFDFAAFQDLLSKESDLNVKITTKTESDIVNFISRLYTAILNTKDKHSLLLGQFMRAHFIDTLQVLVKFTKFNLDSDLDKIAESQQALKAFRRDSITIADMQQVVYRQQFADFAAQVTGDTKALYMDSILLFENMPLSTEFADGCDVRLEPLLRKLTTHVRNVIKQGSGARAQVMESDVLETAVWLIKTWRLLLERHIGIDTEVYCCCVGDTHIEVPESAARFQELFNSCGVTHLCLELIAVGIEERLILESIYLLICLLLGSHYHDVQLKIASYLKVMDSTLFFQQINEFFEHLTLWSHKAVDISAENEEDEELGVSQTAKKEEQLPAEIAIFRFLQLACRDNCLPCQNIIREQTNNSKVFSVINMLSSYVDCLSRIEGPLFTIMAIHVVKTILALVKGPCKENQEQFVLQTEVLVSINRLLRAGGISDPYNTDWFLNFDRLKECCIDVLRASIEDQPNGSVILERVANNIELNVLHVLLLPAVSTMEGTSKSNVIVVNNEKRNHLLLVPVQAKYMVLRHTLLELTEDQTFVIPNNEVYGKSISCVEVVWNGDVHRHYYYIPDIANDLTYFTKEMLYEAMDSSTREIQLRAFIASARLLYIESTNQRALRQMGFGNIVRWKKWLLRLTFFNALLINGILIFAYTKSTSHCSSHDDHAVDDHAVDDHAADDHALVDDHVRRLVGTVTGPRDDCGRSYIADFWINIVIVLNAIQVFLAVISVVILALVRVPTTYRTYRESGAGLITSAWKTSLDPISLWYLVYLGCSLLGLFYNPLFLSVLLLDFVMIDSTTRDVLFAVADPARQLVSAFVLVCIVVYIFAAVIFELFWFDIITFKDTSLWETLKITLSYGIRGEYGVSHEMTNTTGNRMIFDLVFFMVVLMILRHIFHAIIIDGFGKLRELKFEREEFVNNTCFICGVDRHEFDHLCGPGTDGFTVHRESTHKLWNYLLFIVLIWHQSPDEDDGIEMHVRKCLLTDDVSWLPAGLSKQTIKECGASVSDEHAPAAASRGTAAHGASGGHSGHGHGHGHAGKDHKHHGRKTEIQPFERGAVDARRDSIHNRRSTDVRAKQSSQAAMNAQALERLGVLLEGKFSAFEDKLQQLQGVASKSQGAPAPLITPTKDLPKPTGPIDKDAGFDYFANDVYSKLDSITEKLNALTKRLDAREGVPGKAKYEYIADPGNPPVNPSDSSTALTKKGYRPISAQDKKRLYDDMSKIAFQYGLDLQNPVASLNREVAPDVQEGTGTTPNKAGKNESIQSLMKSLGRPESMEGSFTTESYRNSEILGGSDSPSREILSPSQMRDLADDCDDEASDEEY